MDRRDLDFETFDEVLEDVHRLAKEGYTPLGQWDLSQVCSHLMLALVGSIDGYDFRLPWLFRKLLAPLILRSVFKTRRLRPGIKSPKSLVPRPNLDQEEAVRDLDRAMTRLLEHRGELQLHPVFDRLSRENYHQFHLIHCAHHLSFLIPNA